MSHFYFRRFSSGKDTKDGAAFIGKRRTADLTINDCVIQNVQECSSVKIWKSGSVPYFCGEDEICFDPSTEGLQLAIKNLKNFPFIGLTSDFDNSILILEKMFPAYFDSLSHSFREVQEAAKAQTSTGHKEQFRNLNILIGRSYQVISKKLT